MRGGFSVYVLWSEKLGKRYVGSSVDAAQRLDQHNRGMSRFTASGMPWVLRYVEYYATNGLARRREAILKTGAGRVFLDRVFSRYAGYPEAELPVECTGYRIV